MTLAGPGKVVLPDVEIQDYPDIPGRMCANWVLAYDWEVNGYDWGDGFDAFVKRCKRKIDFCSRYKVNRVRFLGGRISPGPPYMKDRYEKIKRFALELNRYARRKGVVLQFSSSSCGVDYLGRGGSTRGFSTGRVIRTGQCTLAWEGPAGPACRTRPWCRLSPDASGNWCKTWNRVRSTCTTSTWPPMLNWSRLGRRRCPRCRQQFPDDEPYSARGYAGAVAGLYNRIIAELKTVKCPESGYDAARDLEIVFASPGYSYWPESDAQWENDLKYFSEIGRQLTDKRNVQITFREQYHRLDNRGLAHRGDGPGFAMRRLAPCPLRVRRAGGGFPRTQTTCSSPVPCSRGRGTARRRSTTSTATYTPNCKCWPTSTMRGTTACWARSTRSRSPAARFVKRRRNTRQAQRHSDFLFGRFLDAACAALYGERAAASMAAMFRLECDKGPILPCVAWIDFHWQDSAYPWRAQAERNRQAKQLVDRAAAACDTAAKADLVWMSRCLEVSARFCTLCDALHREKLPWADIDARAGELLAWLDANFQFQVAEPDGGGPGPLERSRQANP